MGKKAKSKKKRKSSPIVSELQISIPADDQVMLGVRLSKAERDKIKLYALLHHTSIALLIRQYINSLPDPDQ